MMIRTLKNESDYWPAKSEKGVWNYSYAFTHSEQGAAKEIFNREIAKLRELKKELVLFEIQFSNLESRAFFLLEKEYVETFEKKYLKVVE